MIRDQARRALAEYPLDERLRDLLTRKGDFDRDLWALGRDLGWTGIVVSAEQGGLGLGMAELAILAEETGRALASLPLVPGAVATIAVQNWGSDAQRERWLPPFAAGETIGCVALPDREGSEAPLRFDGGRVSGSLPVVCAGAITDLLVAPVLYAEGQSGLALIELAGAKVEPCDTIDNSRGYARIAFDSAEAELLDAAGAGAAETLLGQLALASAFEQIGGAEACLYGARDYALERQVFAQPIGAFQAIKHRLADIYAMIEVARGNAAAALAADPKDAPLAIAAARLTATKAYEYAAQEAIQIHGGIGVTWEAPWHLHHRRARCLASDWEGPAYWRDIIVDGLAAKEGAS
jgi:alkylation response protein AidB-like acyl-CoA dehydrogenase